MSFNICAAAECEDTSGNCNLLNFVFTKRRKLFWQAYAKHHAALYMIFMHNVWPRVHRLGGEHLRMVMLCHGLVDDQPRLYVSPS